MANIDRAIEKLAYFEMKDFESINVLVLREILLAMKDDKPEHSHQTILEDVKMAHKRIGAIEERCGCKVKWRQEVEQRLNNMERILGILQRDMPEPPKHHPDSYQKDDRPTDTIRISRKTAEILLQSYIEAIGITYDSKITDELRKALYVSEESK